MDGDDYNISTILYMYLYFLVKREGEKFDEKHVYSRGSVSNGKRGILKEIGEGESEFIF